MARRRAHLVACLFICLGLAGCAGKAIVAGDVWVLVSERPAGGMDALASGRLEVVGGGFVLEHTPGERPARSFEV